MRREGRGRGGTRCSGSSTCTISRCGGRGVSDLQVSPFTLPHTSFTLTPHCSWGGQEVPIVRFRNGAETEILPSLFSTSVQNTGDCRRVQVPLKLAWVRAGLGQVRGQLAITSMKSALLSRAFQLADPLPPFPLPPPPSAGPDHPQVPGPDPGPGAGLPQGLLRAGAGLRGAQPRTQPGGAADPGLVLRLRQDRPRGHCLLRSAQGGGWGGWGEGVKTDCLLRSAQGGGGGGAEGRLPDYLLPGTCGMLA